MLTNERLQEMRARCEAATPGPWGIGWLGDERDDFTLSVLTTDRIFVANVDDSKPSDAQFIAHAREDVSALLDEVTRLRYRDRKYSLMLLSELQKVRRQGEGAETLYFSDGLQGSVRIIRELEEAGLFVRVGDGLEDHIFGKLTAEGLKMMGGGECCARKS
mgnify:CR=1 FL=1